MWGAGGRLELRPWIRDSCSLNMLAGVTQHKTHRTGSRLGCSLSRRRGFSGFAGG